jgi:hypothetical protein
MEEYHMYTQIGVTLTTKEKMATTSSKRKKKINSNDVPFRLEGMK